MSNPAPSSNVYKSLTNVLYMIREVKRIAGTNLEHYSALDQPTTKYLDQYVANFWSYCLEHLRDGGDHSYYSVRFFARVYEVRAFCRQLAYAKAAREYEALPFPFCETLDCWHDRSSRKIVAARILWIEQRITKGLIAYPALGEKRYANLTVCQETLRTELSEGMRWLVDWAIIPSLETTSLINYVSILMAQEQQWGSELTTTLTSLVAHKVSRIPRVDEFTTPSSRLGATRSKSRQIEKEREPCGICTLAFENTSSGSLSSRHAVATKCGHVLCASCLRSWTETGKSSCPFCRQALYDSFLVLPKELSLRLKKIGELFSEFHGLDESVDGYLSERPDVEVHDEKFVPMIKAMYVLNQELHKAIDRWDVSVETAMQGN